LDLWKTAKPHLEKWMQERIGLKALLSNLQQESMQWSQIMPALPRLIHHRLAHEDNLPAVSHQLSELRRAHERTTRYLRWLALLMSVLVATILWLLITRY